MPESKKHQVASALSAEFERNLRISGQILPGDRVLVACSGGPDSTALFHLLRNLRHWKLKLVLVHINHGLRGRQALRDETFVRKLAVRCGVPFSGARAGVKALARRQKLSIEEAARELRYRAFKDIAGKRRIQKVVLAHTLDDQAETVLMRILQGTGMRGLLAIRSERKLGRATVVRPLLNFRKKDVLEYLKSGGHAWVHDQSNESSRFLRNRIRNHLLPLLEKQFNPRIRQALARIPAGLADDFDILSGLEDQGWRRLKVALRGGRLGVSRKVFEEQPPSIRFRLLNRMLKRIDPSSGLSFDNWEALRPCFAQKKARRSLQKDIDIELTLSRIMLYKKKHDA